MAVPNYYDYFDYTGLAYYGGYFYPAWADNSISTGNNPDCPPYNNPTWQMDIYVARVKYSLLRLPTYETTYETI